jgi:hypothetical protein
MNVSSFNMKQTFMSPNINIRVFAAKALIAITNINKQTETATKLRLRSMEKNRIKMAIDNFDTL